MTENEIPSDWIAVSAPIKPLGLVDPTESVEPPVPGSKGIVISVSSGRWGARVAFNGGEYLCTVLGPAVSVGAEVTMILMHGDAWCIRASAEYPSAWGKPLWLWMGDHPASLLLRYIMRNNPKRRRYETAWVTALYGDGTAAVWMPDGTYQRLAIFFGTDVSTVAVGQCVLYYRNDIPEVIGIGDLAVCEIGTITASDMWVSPGRVYSQQLIPVDFTPIAWSRPTTTPLVQMTIDNAGLLTFAGLNRAQDIWLTGLYITPQNGISATVQKTDDLDPVLTWEIISVTPILTHASHPPTINAAGLLELEF